MKATICRRNAANGKALLLIVVLLTIIVAMAAGYAIMKGGAWNKTQTSDGASNSQSAGNPGKSSNAQTAGKDDSVTTEANRTGVPKKNDKATSVVIVDGRKQIKVRVVWKDGGAGIPGVTLSAMQPRAWNHETTLTAKTGSDGWAKLLFPMEWSGVGIKAVHPDIATQYAHASTPPAIEQIIKAERGATVFGKVFLKDKRPAAKAQVWVMNASDAATTAGADGAYEITGLPGGYRQLVAALGDGISNSGGREPVLTELKPGERIGPCDLFLGTGLSLSGAVRDLESNQPVANAEVSQTAYGPRGMGGSGPKAKSGSDGVFRLDGLPIGRVSVVAMASGYVSEPASVQITSGALNTCEMLLEPGSTVTVRVVDTSSAPVSGAQVYVQSGSLGWRGGRQDQIQTDAKGEVALNGISVRKPPQISVYKENYQSRMAVRPVFESGAHTAEVRIVLHPISPRNPKDDPTSKSEAVVAFKGRVTDAQDAPVAGAKVYWGYRWNLQTGDSAVTDSDGAYRLEAKKELAGSQTLRQLAQDHVLAVFAKGYAPASKRQTTGGTAEAPLAVDFKLAAGHWVGGVVVNGKGEPLAGLQVSVNIQDSSGEDTGFLTRQPHAREIRTSAEGKFRQEDLPKRVATVTISGKGWSSYNKEIPLDQETRIVMKEGGVIKGRVVEGMGETPVKDFAVVPVEGDFGPYGERNPIQFHAADGSFTLYDLQQEQRYSIKVQARGYSPAQMSDLSGSAEAEATPVVFKLSKTVETKGQVFDAADQKPIAGAEVLAFEADATDSGRGHQFRSGWGGYDENENVTRTDKSGAFTIQETENPGPLLIRAENYASLSIAPDDRAQYGGAHSLRIGLKRGGMISGTVTKAGKPEANISVFANRSSDGSGNMDPAEQRANQGANVQTDENGAYKLASLRAGTYTLSVSKYESGVSMTRTAKCDLAEGEYKTLDIALDGGKGILYGRILKGQTPVPEANLNIYPKNGGNGSSRQVKSGANGEYRVEGIEEGWYSAGIYAQGDFGNINFSEEIEISGETQHDFIIPERHKITATIVFDGVEDPAPMPRVTNGNLSFNHNSESNRDDRKGIDSYSYCQSPVDNQLVFQARLKGEYTLSFNCRSGEKSSISYNVPDPLKLDNLAADQDLGEIHVKYGGASSLKGFVLNLGGKPIKDASISLSPVNRKGGENATFSATTNDQGRYEIQGVTDGSYNASVSKSGPWRSGAAQDSMRMNEKVEIKGATEHDFILLTNYKVTARLVFAAGQTDTKFTDLRDPSINLNSDGRGNENADLQISNYGNGVIDRKGQVTFTGRYLGRYSMRVQVKHGSIEIPTPFQLDNMDHDQDLGEIALPGVNFVRLVLTFNAPPGISRPNQGQLLFAGEKTDASGRVSRFTNGSGINFARESNLAGPIPEGTNRVSLQISGWKASPDSVPISIDAGHPAEAAFTLTPSNQVRGYVSVPPIKGRMNPPTRITLAGPGGERVLIPVPYSQGSQQDLWSGRDMARGNEFVFWDVPDGTWRLTVEAEDCEPATREVSVKLGVAVERMNIKMKRNP